MDADLKTWFSPSMRDDLGVTLREERFALNDGNAAGLRQKRARSASEAEPRMRCCRNIISDTDAKLPAGMNFILLSIHNYVHIV